MPLQGGIEQWVGEHSECGPRRETDIGGTASAGQSGGRSRAVRSLSMRVFIRVRSALRDVLGTCN